MSQKITVTAYIQGHLNWEGKPEYIPSFSKNMENMGYFHVGTAEVEIELPDGFEPTAEAVRILEKEKIKIRAELAEKITRIDRQIASLQALPA